MSRFYAGLDLGQTNDYSCLVAIEKQWDAEAKHLRYDLRHLERFPLKTPYPVIVSRVTEMMNTPPLNTAGSLVVDQTGCGRPVVDMFKPKLGHRLKPVTITGGDTETETEGGWRVPKRDLVSVVQVLLQQKRLRFAPGLPEVETLINELLQFQVKISLETAHDSYGAWREGTHDDMVLALALVCWHEERHPNLMEGIGFIPGVGVSRGSAHRRPESGLVRSHQALADLINTDRPRW